MSQQKTIPETTEVEAQSPVKWESFGLKDQTG